MKQNVKYQKWNKKKNNDEFSHDKISGKLNRNFLIRTMLMFYVCMNHVIVAVVQLRKCEIFLRKRSKVMTKPSQVQADNTQKYIFTNRTRALITTIDQD